MVLSSPALVEERDALRFELGVAYAAQGHLEEALGHFRELLKQGLVNEGARQTTIEVLTALASRHAEAREWDRVTLYLEEALALRPDEPALRRYLDAAREAQPLSLLAAGKRAEAVAAWERTQRAAPDKVAIAHRLAMALHQSAIEAEALGRVADADDLWPRAAENWAVVAASDAFWARWTVGRQAVYGMTVPEKEVVALREAGLRDRLEQIHRDFEAAYRQAGTSAAADRHRDYRFQLRLEFLAATLMREAARVVTRHKRPLSTSLCAGPMFLVRADLLEAAQRLAADAHQLDRDAEGPQRLMAYLSPLGFYHLLLEERQTELVIDRLRARVDAAADSKRGGRTGQVAAERALLARAYRESAAALSGTPDQAIDRAAEGLRYDDSGDLREFLVTTCVARSQALEEEDGHDAAIKVLRQGLRHVPGSRELKVELSAVLNRKSVRLANRERLSEARPLLEEALQLDPQNDAAKRNLTQVQLVAVFEHMKAERWDEAIAALRPVLAGDPSHQEARTLMGVACNAKGVSLVNTALERVSQDRSGALAQMKEARGVLELGMRYDPTNEKLKENLQQLVGMLNRVS